MSGSGALADLRFVSTKRCESITAAWSGVLPDQSLAHQPAYHSVIDVQFVSRALDAGANLIRGAAWATEALYPYDAPEILASAYYEYRRTFEVLATEGDALAHIIRHGENVTVRIAARSHSALEAAERGLREKLPEHTAAPSDVAVEFSHWHCDAGARVTTRTLAVPSLAEIHLNYPSHVRQALKGLATAFRPGSDGRLMLWHGLPGSGKTWALRGLASEWRDWCRLRYVTDPERLLEEPGYLVDVIHSRPGIDRDGKDWRLVVLEDTGELLAADARQQAGQGLSRLLNVADGLLGQSANIFFLVTTNEDLRTLHPAVSRPGRCAQVLEFGALSPEESNRWLAAQGCELTVARPTTLAELFAVRDGTDISASRRQPVGFA